MFLLFPLDSPHHSRFLTCRGRIPAAVSSGAQDPNKNVRMQNSEIRVSLASHLIPVQGGAGVVTVQRCPPRGQPTVNIETEKRILF